MRSDPIALSVFRNAWRDLKQELHRGYDPAACTRPRLRRSRDGLAAILQTSVATLGLTWTASIEVPLVWGALRLGWPLRSALQRLADGQIRRSYSMTCDEWREVQGAARLGLAVIVAGDGWEAFVTPAGLRALRRGWIS